jgi:lipoate-protein ligase A
VLRDLGTDARVGELPGEYCPGGHSIHARGIKVAGIGQRAIRRAANTSAVVVVGGGETVRALVAAVYAALELDVDATTAGSLDEVAAGLGIDAVADAIREAYASRAGGLRPSEPDDALYARARELLPRHRAP